MANALNLACPDGRKAVTAAIALKQERHFREIPLLFLREFA